MYWNSPGFDETKKDFGENVYGYLTPNNAPQEFYNKPAVYSNMYLFINSTNIKISLKIFTKFNL